jgi:predicted acylesterase/phospholipase RssA
MLDTTTTQAQGIHWRIHAVALLAVAAPLQTLETTDGKPLVAYQSWAAEAVPVLAALEAALAMPPLFAPVHLEGDDARQWLAAGVRDVEGGIDLVDGSVIRQNPLPSLFDFLRRRPELARRLEADADGARVLRSVLMKPEHEDAVPWLAKRLDHLAQQATTAAAHTPPGG